MQVYRHHGICMPHKLCLSRQITKCFLDYIGFTFLETFDEAHMCSLDGERKDSFFLLF